MTIFMLCMYAARMFTTRTATTKVRHTRVGFGVLLAGSAAVVYGGSYLLKKDETGYSIFPTLMAASTNHQPSVSHFEQGHLVDLVKCVYVCRILTGTQRYVL